MDELTTLEDLDTLLAESQEKPVFLYKHSSVCPVSSNAYMRVRAFQKEAQIDLPPIKMVKVIESRPVSNAVQDKLGVRHESPQLILVSDGKAVANTSHHDITGDWITEVVATQV